jgi:hypothetical protein
MFENSAEIGEFYNYLHLILPDSTVRIPFSPPDKKTQEPLWFLGFSFVYMGEIFAFSLILPLRDFG